MLLNYFAIFIGGGLGACLRHYTTLISHKHLGMAYPYGTFGINILGSFFLGFVATLALSKTNLISPEMKLFLTTGIAGGFTTFSTFSYEMLTLLKNGQPLACLIYAILSITMGFCAVYAGYSSARCF